jgi:hypothetical protein
LAVLRVSLWFTFSAMQLSGSPCGDWEWGLQMDSTAFHELIAQVRGTAAALAEAEQKVAAFKVELAQQEHGAQLDTALQRAIGPIAISAPKLPGLLRRED